MAVLVRRRTMWVLGRPSVLFAPSTSIQFGPAVQLAPSARQARAAHSALREPVVVTPRPLAPEIRTSLARNKVPGRIGRLGAPVVVNPIQPLPRPVKVSLVASPRQARRAHPVPPFPVLVFAPPLTRPLDVTLARNKTRKTVHVLGPPTVTTAAVTQIFSGPETHLARSRRGAPKSRLGRPAVVAIPSAGLVKITLANARRDLQRRALNLGMRWRDSGVYPYGSGSGVFGNNAAWPLTDPGVDGRGDIVGTIYTLTEAADVYAVTAHFNQTHGSMPFRGVIYQTDGAGTVLAASPLATTVEVVIPGGAGNAGWYTAPLSVSVHLPAGQYLIGIWFGDTGGSLDDDPTHGAGRYSASADHIPNGYSTLGAGPQWVTNAGLPTYTAAWAVYASFSSDQTAPFPLRYPQIGPWPPALTAPLALARPVEVTAARIRPAAVHSHLRPPTDTVGLEDQGRIRVTLARNKVPGRFCRLGAPVVLAPVASETFSGPLVELAYSRRGTVKSILRRPVLVRAASLARPLDLTLAYSRRGKSKPRLAPAILTPFVAQSLRVALAPSRRPRPISLLRRPTVVRLFVAGPLSVTLAPQARGRAKSHLRQIGYPPRPLHALAVALAPSSRRARAAHSRLSPPTVLNVPVVHEAIVKFAQIRPPGFHSILRPPAVVTPAEFFTGPQVTLVRIRPAATRWRLRPAAVVTPICYGTVVGFDFAPEVCGSDDGALAQGDDTGIEVCGDDQAATAQGASAPGGSVSGGDEKREGC